MTLFQDTSGQNAPASNNPLPRNVWLLSWASLLNDTASEIIFSLTPAFLKAIGGTAQHLGVLEGLADTIAALLKLKSGRWSDQLGSRRWFVVFGYVVASLIRPLSAFVTAPWQLITVRSIDRVGKGLRSAPRDALLAESVAPSSRGRAFGLHRAMDHLGAALGPALATAFLYFYPGQVRWLFGLTLIPGLLVLAVVLLVREARPPETTPDKSPTVDLTPTQALPGRFRWFLSALFIFALGNSSDAFLLNRCLDLGVAELWLPTIWLAFHLAKSLGNVFVGRLVDRVGPRGPLLIGWTIYCITYLGFAGATAAWQAIGLFMVYALYYALSEPAEKTLVTQLVPAEQKGQAFGWYHFAEGIAALPANLVFGTLYADISPWAAFGLGAVLAGIASGMVAWLSGMKQTLATNPG
jgi:MFS family permease